MFPELRTARLILRPWRDEDLAYFAGLNADPRVMEHLPQTLDRAESDLLAARIRGHFSRHGYGLWALEAPGVASFLGFTGLCIPSFDEHFTPCVEIGWRLAWEYWGRGYATEAARASLAYGFQTLGLDEIVAMTVPRNTRSRRVMEKLEMSYRPEDDFGHPRVPEGHPLRRHVLYRLSRRAWELQQP
jgi:ribosomal-protein-alanine N-acetyltransferase